jgi:hypothetical protein
VRRASLGYPARMADTDPQRLADQREREVDQLQQRSDELASEVSDVSQDWHRKRSDQGVPGAQPHDRDDADEDSSGPQAEPEEDEASAEEETREDADEEPDGDAPESKADKGGEG